MRHCEGERRASEGIVRKGGGLVRVGGHCKGGRRV